MKDVFKPTPSIEKERRKAKWPSSSQTPRTTRWFLVGDEGMRALYIYIFPLREYIRYVIPSVIIPD